MVFAASSATTLPASEIFPSPSPLAFSRISISGEVVVRQCLCRGVGTAAAMPANTRRSRRSVARMMRSPPSGSGSVVGILDRVARDVGGPDVAEGRRAANGGGQGGNRDSAAGAAAIAAARVPPLAPSTPAPAAVRGRRSSPPSAARAGSPPVDAGAPDHAARPSRVPRRWTSGSNLYLDAGYRARSRSRTSQ